MGLNRVLIVSSQLTYGKAAGAMALGTDGGAPIEQFSRFRMISISA